MFMLNKLFKSEFESEMLYHYLKNYAYVQTGEQL